MNTHIVHDEKIKQINSDFSSSITNLEKIYTLLYEITQSNSIEIFFYNQKDDFYFDKIKGTKIESQYLDTDSFLGHVFNTKKPLVSQDIEKNPHYNTAIDNPFKIKMRAQMVIPITFNEKVEGLIRCSRQDEPFTQETMEIIKRIMNSFKDIFLNERHQTDMEILRHPFTLDTVEVYKAIKDVKNIYLHLLNHTQNPEIQKLLKEGQSTIDSVFRYLNPNMDNVAKVKNQLRQFKKHQNDEKSLKVLIADDVLMNVKILNSMLSSDNNISEIETAYDGNQTFELMDKSCKSNDQIDVLFLDHHMPGKLGLEIAQFLKNNYCKTVIVSITNDPDAIKNHLHLYDFHLSKPFSKIDIDNILNEIKNTRFK